MNCLFCNKEIYPISSFSFGEVRQCKSCDVNYNFSDSYTGYSFQFYEDHFIYHFSCLDKSKATIFYVTSLCNPSYYHSVKLDRLFTPNEAKKKLQLILTML